MGVEVKGTMGMIVYEGLMCVSFLLQVVAERVVQYGVGADCPE